jgi:transposase
MDELSLSRQQRRQLERQLSETTDARLYRRTLAVLEVSRGVPIAEIAKTLAVSRQSIYNWVSVYSESFDPKSLVDAPRPGRPSAWTTPRQSLLQDVMQVSPEALGYYAGNWTVSLLQDYLERYIGCHLSENTIRRELARLDFVWKRSRYVLQPDPDEEKKTPNLPGNQPFAAAHHVVGSG